MCGWMEWCVGFLPFFGRVPPPLYVTFLVMLFGDGFEEADGCSC